jgi:glycosyltransferase involved in cell wall biosynthesis
MRAHLSVVVPVYNEAPNLRPLAAEIHAALEPLGRPYEVLFVDDGSTDDGPRILAELAAADPRLRILRLPRNCGQSAAFAAGFRAARGEVVVTLDADLQNDPADIPRLLAELPGRDVVCGVRVARRDSSLRRFSSRIANAVRNRVTHESIADVGCSLRAYRIEFLHRIPMFDGMHRFLPTLLRLEGAVIVEVPVAHRPRRYGRAKYNIRNRLWRALADLVAVRWMQSRWIDRRSAEEVPPWPTRLSGSGSDSPARPSSSLASSSSGSPPSDGRRA